MKKKFTKTISQNVKRIFAIGGFFLLTLFVQAQATLIPFTGSTSVPCGSNVVVQAHNGSSGTYAISADGYVVLNAGALAVINIAGTYTTEAGFDFIRIYNGVGTGGTLLGTFSGQNLSLNYTGTPGQTLTVRFSSDGSINFAGINLNVTYTGACYSVACSGAPASNTVVGPSVLICPNAGPNPITLTNSYISGGSPATATAQTGLTYVWVTGTTSAVGPFGSAIPGATTGVYSAPGTSVTTYYQAVITCTNGSPQTTSATAGVVQIAGTTTSVVPYYEGFEGIGYTNKLPNCSWSAPTLGTTFRTFTTSGSNNTIPNSGTNFAAFAAPANNVSAYTNGIQMEPGITYSAAIHYATDYIGSGNWTNLNLSVGPNQSAVGLVQLATAAPAVSGPYKLLSATFTVPNSGLYYLRMNANGTSGTAPYLMIDDISVTIPCTPASGNSPTLTASANGSVFCQNDPIAATASGANSYTWSTGDNTSVTTLTALAIGNNTITVSGTNSLTGCSSSETVVVNLKPAPPLSVFANNPVSCAGQPVNISAFGQGSFQWSTGGLNSFITVSPTTTAVYNVNLTGANGCASSASIQIVVNPLPQIGIQSIVTDACAGDQISLAGTGAVSYVWTWNVNISQSPVLIVQPMTTTTFTLVGTNANGCSNKTIYTQNVSICSGISESTAGAALHIYPNPGSGLFTVEAGSSSVLSAQVTDIAGRQIMDLGMLSGTTTVDLTQVASGVYYLTVNSSTDGNRTYKIIKQ